MKSIETVSQLYQYISETHSNPRALNWRDDDGSWLSLSTQEYLQQVRRVALGLVARGIRPGDKVGIMARPCPGWTVADLAIIATGAVVVPLYANLSDENYIYEIEQTGLKTLFVSGKSEWEKCGKHRDWLDTVISLDDECPDPTAVSVENVMLAGDGLNDAEPDLWNRLLLMAEADDVASIVYSSGSTGVPKGVEVTHRNLTGLLHLDPLHWDSSSDKYLSFLPLAHIFARVLNYIMIQAGVSIYYLDDIQAAAPVAKELKPTILVLVPRLLERVYSKIVTAMRDTRGVLHMIGQWALRLAEREDEGGWWIKAQRFVANLLIYRSLRGIFGNNMRVVISGGAKLSPHLGHFFTNLGYPIFEGWGMTEACPITVNDMEKSQIGTVGRPLDGVDVIVSEAGELLVRGPNVMRGYYRNPDATAEVLSDGWLATGDQGTIDADGFITIVGRTKELYKTSTGEYVAPIPIEQALAKDVLVDHALVIAEARSFCSCLLFPDFEALEGLKVVYGMTELSDEEFLATPQMRQELEKHFKEVNSHLNHWEEVHAYKWVHAPLTIDDGDLTPTLKIRRDVVIKKYGDLVEEMYPTKEVA